MNDGSCPYCKNDRCEHLLALIDVTFHYFGAGSAEDLWAAFVDDSQEASEVFRDTLLNVSDDYEIDDGDADSPGASSTTEWFWAKEPHKALTSLQQQLKQL